MTDIVERLRGLYVSAGTNYVQEAAYTIERLREELALALTDVSRLVEELAEARSALRSALEYVRHDPMCNHNLDWRDSEWRGIVTKPCDCGLTAFLDKYRERRNDHQD